MKPCTVSSSALLSALASPLSTVLFMFFLPPDASNVLSHPPLSAHPMNHSPPPAPLQSTSNSSPVTSPVLNLSINSNGSSCSVSSTSSNQPVPASGSAPVSSHHQPQSGKMINSSASTKKTLVSPSAKKAHHFMVAMEPAYFNGM